MSKSQSSAPGRFGLVLAVLVALLAPGLTCSVWGQTIVVDDLSSGSTYTGAWTLRNTGSTFYSTTYRDINADIRGTASFIWSPSIPSTGEYEVSVWYPTGTNNCAKASYIVSGVTMQTFLVDQKKNGGSWVPLGIAGFVEGTTTAKIRLRNSSDAVGKVVADAVKLEKIGTEYSSSFYQGAWVYSWGAGILSASQTARTFADCRKYNLNAIFPEIRKVGDAYYISEIEPKATNIESGYADPLADIIKNARDTSRGKQAMEVHGWFIPYRVWNGGEPPANHITRRHPEWMGYDYYGFPNGSDLDPGVPGVSDYLIDVLVELVSNYDIDGIQFDYIRYSSNTLGYNPISLKRFQELYGRTDRPAPDDPEFSEFRRRQISAFVRRAYAKVKEVRWDVKMSASTVTWLPAPPEGDFTKTRPYGDVFCDWVGMMKEGSLDINIPMIYMRDHISSQYDGYRSWVDTSAANTYDRHLIIGPGSYLNTIENNVEQMLYARDQENVHGLMPYRFGYTSINQDDEDISWKAMVSNVFDVTREIPAADWLENPTTGILYGTVRDTAGNLIDGATVTIQKDQYIWDNTYEPIPTDGSGVYAFVKMESGEYFKAEAKFGDMIGSASFNIQSGTVTKLDITVMNHTGVVTPDEPFLSRGYHGGPFEPASIVYSVTNPGPAPLFWGMISSETWLKFEPEYGVLLADEVVDVTVSINDEALAFGPGIYGSTITFASALGGFREIRSATLTIFDNFDAVAEQDLDFRGYFGGPFLPEERSVTLHNFGDADIPWSVVSDQSWVEVVPSSGTVAKGVDFAKVQITDSAGLLHGKTDPYMANLVFRNQLTGYEATAEVKLTVDKIAVMPFVETFEQPLDTYWRVAGSGYPRSDISGSNNPYQGMQHFLMDSRYKGFSSRNELTLGLDLLGYSNVMLRFYAKEFSDEPNGPPAIPFENSANFDGVAVSADGETWCEVHSLRDLTSSYTLQQVNLDEAINKLAEDYVDYWAVRDKVLTLDEAIDELGLRYNDQFLIRFNHYGNDSIPDDGFAIDYITVTGDIDGQMQVSPEEDFLVLGDRFGFFEPLEKTYTVSNEGKNDIAYLFDSTQDWVTVSPSFGVLSSGSIPVMVQVDEAKVKLLDPGVYESLLSFKNLDSGVTTHRTAVLRNTPKDYVTELFDLFDNDMSNRSMSYYYSPEFGTYLCCRQVDDVTQFSNNPALGTRLLLGDNASAKITLTGTDRFKFYGKEIREIYVNSNGYVTFGQEDSLFTESILEHFQLPRISVLFDDFDPSEIGARITWQQKADRVVVTWENVPEFDTTNSNSFQLEMFYSGRIQMTYLGLDAQDGLVGISEGMGLPQDFVESDLSTCPPCARGMMLIAK